jgi:hypothetical protein
MSETFNGWASYHTWNVALYIQNEYNIYSLARDWAAERREYGESVDYDVFRHTLTELVGDITPDGVSYSDPSLDVMELSEMLQEL